LSCHYRAINQGGLPVRIPFAVGAIATSAALFGASPGFAQGEVPFPFIAPQSTYMAGGAPPSMEAWLSVGATRDFVGANVGGVVAFNGNVWSDGFVVRGEGQVGREDATSPRTDDFWSHGASLLFGYRARVGDGLLTGYIGANYEAHDNDDRFAQIRGTEVGFRALGEYYTRFTPFVDFYGTASYSTAFDTFFAFGRVGFKVVDTVWVGPELTYFQNEDSSQDRLGGFVRFEQTFTGGGITFAGGWVNSLDRGTSDGWYANVNLNFQFR
jgi:hypothetical protein